MKNTIGLDVQQAQQLTEKLNYLLANYQLYYQNLRGLNWNINGREFFELHQKFEEFYEDAFLKIDEIAERILTLGGQPLHTLSNYLKQSEIKEATEVCDAVEGVTLVVENLSILLRKERSIFAYTSNGKYVFGFLVIWLPGLLFHSKAACSGALFNHLFIWGHYYFTERPDMRLIYKNI